MIIIQERINLINFLRSEYPAEVSGERELICELAEQHQYMQEDWDEMQTHDYRILSAALKKWAKEDLARMPRKKKRWIQVIAFSLEHDMMLEVEVVGLV